MQKLDDYDAWLKRGPLWRFALLTAVSDLAVISLVEAIGQLVIPESHPVGYAITLAAGMTAWQTWRQHQDTRPGG